MKLKEEEKENKEKKQFSNQSKGIFENGGFGNFAPRKRNYREYRDIFLSNIKPGLYEEMEKFYSKGEKNGTV